MVRVLAIVFAVLIAATSGAAQAQSGIIAQTQSQIEKGVDSITSGIGEIVNSFDADKLKQKSDRDLLTLGIGGAAGYAVGAVVSGIGLVNINLIGISMIPVAGALAGIYLANEGYFDKVRGAFN